MHPKLKELHELQQPQRPAALRQGSSCVIYTRVSTQEQADTNGSLQTQMKYCREYAVRHGLEVVECFGDTYESAKSDKERKEFQRMLRFVRGTKRITSILVFSLDRFSRTGSQASVLIQELDQMGVSVRSVTQDMFSSSSPHAAMMRDITMVYNAYDNHLRREKCLTGTKEKMLQGHWPSRPPKGYEITSPPKNPCDRRTYRITKEGELIRRAFELKLEGFSFTEIHRKLRPLGLSILEKHLKQYLTNVFYCGYITSHLIDHQLVKGHHPAIVNESDYVRVQKLIFGKSPETIKRKKIREGLHLKGFLQSDEGEPYTGYYASKNGQPYYKIKEGKHPNNISGKQVHMLMERVFDRISLRDEHKACIKHMLRAKLKEAVGDQNEESELLEKEIAQAQGRLDRLEEKYLDGLVDQAFFNKHHSLLTSTLEKGKERLAFLASSRSNHKELLEIALEFAANLNKTYRSGDFITKRKLQELVFPKGIQFNKQEGRVRTQKVNPVFSVIASSTGDSVIQKERGSELEFHFPVGVGAHGFEPRTLCL